MNENGKTHFHHSRLWYWWCISHYIELSVLQLMANYYLLIYFSLYNINHSCLSSLYPFSSTFLPLPAWPFPCHCFFTSYLTIFALGLRKSSTDKLHGNKHDMDEVKWNLNCILLFLIHPYYFGGTCWWEKKRKSILKLCCLNWNRSQNKCRNHWRSSYFVPGCSSKLQIDFWVIWKTRS